MDNALTDVMPCGAICGTCEKYPGECPGCDEIQGRVWWVEPIEGVDTCFYYDCCVNRHGYRDCGACAELPCDIFMYSDPSWDPEEKAQLLESQLRVLRREGKEQASSARYDSCAELPVYRS